MGKQINFTYKDQDYTLEFNKRVVKAMENAGFVITDFDKKAMNTLPELFKGAFRMHHKKLKDDYIEEIFTHFTDREALWERLIEMYAEPQSKLFDEPDEDDENLIKWEKTDN